MCGVVACFIRFENESFAGDAFMRRPIFFTYHQLRRNEWRYVANAGFVKSQNVVVALKVEPEVWCCSKSFR